MDVEKIKHHIETLKKRHGELDKEIIEDYKNYVSDYVLETKKKEKLALKDEIEKFIRTID